MRPTPPLHGRICDIHAAVGGLWGSETLRLVVLTVARLHEFWFCLFWMVHQASLRRLPLSAAQGTPRGVKAYHFPNISLLWRTCLQSRPQMRMFQMIVFLCCVSLLRCAFVTFCDTSTSTSDINHYFKMEAIELAQS